MDYAVILSNPLFAYAVLAAGVLLLVGLIYYAWHIWMHDAPLQPHHASHSTHSATELAQAEVASDHMVVKARDVLEQSIDRAKHMLQETDSFQRELEREARDMYTKSARRHERDFEEMVAGMREQYKQIFDKVATTAITEVGKMLSDQRLSVQHYVKERIDQEFEQAKKEIQTYKESQMQQAGSRVDDLVSSIAKNIVSVSLSKAQQKELIYRALEKAAADGVFGTMSPVEQAKQNVQEPKEAAKEVVKQEDPKPPAQTAPLQA